MYTDKAIDELGEQVHQAVNADNGFAMRGQPTQQIDEVTEFLDLSIDAHSVTLSHVVHSFALEKMTEETMHKLIYNLQGDEDDETDDNQHFTKRNSTTNKRTNTTPKSRGSQRHNQPPGVRPLSNDRGGNAEATSAVRVDKDHFAPSQIDGRQTIDNCREEKDKQASLTILKCNHKSQLIWGKNL